MPCQQYERKIKIKADYQEIYPRGIYCIFLVNARTNFNREFVITSANHNFFIKSDCCHVSVRQTRPDVFGDLDTMLVRNLRLLEYILSL